MSRSSRSHRRSSTTSQTRAGRTQQRARRFHLESLEPRQMMSATPPTFRVVDDASANKAFRYSEVGAALGSTALVGANAAPRGVTTMIGVDKSWVIDANRNVYVYNAAGGLLGSWSAGSLGSSATPEGVATNGTDIWILDSKSDKVYMYAGAASRTSGSQNAASSFALNSGNKDAKDIVTDGATLWVVNDSTTDKVFKYSVTGSLVGSWTISSANKAPTGIAIDPANVNDIWISDSGTDRVYKYTGAVSRNSGSQAAAATFNLSASNGNSQGVAVAGRAWAETPHTVEWVRQFGSAGDENARGVVANSLGQIYVSGSTKGSLAAPNPTGASTTFLTKFDAAGAHNWTVQPGSIEGAELTVGVRVAADAQGNVYQVNGVAGSGGALVKYDASGALIWRSPLLPAGEGVFGVAVDADGDAYMSSYAGTSAFLRKVDGATGAILWTRTIETGGATNTSAVAFDGLGNLYVAGYTYGSTIGPNAGLADSFVAKYNTSGNLQWAKQFGTAGIDFAFNLSADALGNVFVGGGAYSSQDDWNSGNQDLFITKLDAAGNVQWNRRLGTTTNDAGPPLWADGLGNVYFCGYTGGALGEYPGAALGGAHLGGADLVVGKYSSAGDLLWMGQYGTSGHEAGPSLTGDHLGNLYVTARTTGVWGGPNSGGFDAVLIKLTPPAQGASAARSLQTVDLAFAAMAWEASQSQGASDAATLVRGRKLHRAQF